MKKILEKIKIGADLVKTLFLRAKSTNLKGLNKNPLFYFGAGAFILLLMIFYVCGSYDSSAAFRSARAALANSFFDSASGEGLFLSQNGKIALETPDLKIAQDNTISGISAPNIVSAKVLGDMFGTGQNNKEVANYIVQPGDTLQSIAETNNISVNTLLWANDIAPSSAIKVGQELAILPVDGVLHVVKSGDMLSAIASK